MSTTKKRSITLIALAIILVSTLAATLYYAIPDNAQARTVAFALGPRSIASTGSEVYSMSNQINVTFQNGTVWQSLWHLEPPDFNSTDITQILILPAPSYGGSLNFGTGIQSLVTLQYAFDWNIHTSTNTTDLGTLDMANYTFSFYSSSNHYPIPYNFSVPTLNYPLYVKGTGNWNTGRPPPYYGPWTWQINTDDIQNIIANTTNPAEVNFDLDVTVNLYYTINIANNPTQSGYAKVSWSGRWAKLLLFHNETQLTGFRYSWTDISLQMITST